MNLDFDPSDAGFNRANALFLAHAANLAYNRSPAKAVREKLGLDAVAFRHPLTRTRGYVGVCDEFAVLAFRGSDPMTLPNWVTDVVVKLVEHEHYDGLVHRGFSSALRRSWKDVSGLLDRVEGRPLFLTGHSMGGALAVLTACRLAKLGRPPVATYTFGSPRIGDRAFCAGFKLPTYRVVNGLDLVPELPLASVKRFLPTPAGLRNEKLLLKVRKFASRLRCYGHVKTLVYIDRDGELIIDADVEPWHTYAVAHALATRGKGFLDGVKDHLLSNYIRGLEGRSRAARPRARTNRTAE